MQLSTVNYTLNVDSTIVTPFLLRLNSSFNSAAFIAYSVSIVPSFIVNTYEAVRPSPLQANGQGLDWQCQCGAPYWTNDIDTARKGLTLESQRKAYPSLVERAIQ